MNTQRQFLIDRLTDARRRLDALIEKAPVDQCIYPNWRIKEYMDHLSGWDDAVVESLHAHARGEPVPQTAARGVNVYNAQTVSTRESLSLEQTKREYTASRQAMIQALRELPDEKLDETMTFAWGQKGSVAELVEIFVEHDEEHARDLEAWLKNPGEVIGNH